MGYVLIVIACAAFAKAWATEDLLAGAAAILLGFIGIVHV